MLDALAVREAGGELVCAVAYSSVSREACFHCKGSVTLSRSEIQFTRLSFLNEGN
jgi:hypothetical protein